MEDSHDFSKGSSVTQPLMQQGKGGRRPRSITYPVIFWVVFTALTLFAILDRFYIHLWEMSFNTAPLPTLFAAPVPYSITFFDNFGRAFGRVFLVSMNALFWTQCKTSENFLMEHHPRWVDLGDLRSVHNRIHYVLGLFFMGIPMVAHCLLIFLPGLSGQPLLVTGPTPVSAVNQFVWANNLLPEVFLTHDNVWRLIMVIALFGVVFPFSVSNYARRKWYGPSLLLHILAAVLFTIDQLRRSPHAQVFSMPVIAYYLLDRFIGLWLHRTGQVSIVHKELLDHDYMVVFLQLGGVKRRRLVGSTLYVQFTGLEGVMDFAHPFVAFQNHSGEQLSPEWTNREGAAAKNYKFYKDRSGAERKFVRRNRGGEEDTELEEKNGADEDEGMYFSSWNTAVIVQIHRWNSGEESFTTKLSRKEVSSRLRYWGPYVTDYANITPDGRFLPPLVLIASGTGAGPLIDFYMHFTANNMELRNQVLVYFSTNSQGLFQFVTDLLCARAIPNFSVNAHLTASEDYDKDFESNGIDPTLSGEERNQNIGRLSYMDVLSGAPKQTEVYFCGAPALQWKVELACTMYGLDFHAGQQMGSSGKNICRRVGPCRFFCQCSRFPLCLCL